MRIPKKSKLESVQDVREAAAELAAFQKPSHPSLIATAKEFMASSERWELSSRDVAYLALVAMGKALPETVLLKCPAADYLCELSIAEQRKYVVKGERLLAPRFDKRGRVSCVRVLAKDLTEEQCKVIFKHCPKWPFVTASFDGDEVLFKFESNKSTGETKCTGVTSIHRDHHGPPKE